jgi:hypothetical protein
MKRVDDTEAKQAMLDALAKYTGPITHGLEPRVETRTKKIICKLSEVGECQREFIPGKKWVNFAAPNIASVGIISTARAPHIAKSKLLRMLKRNARIK